MGVCSGTGCVDGLAHQWGCYPKADSLAFDGKPPRHPGAPTVRLRYGDGTATRHLIR